MKLYVFPPSPRSFKVLAAAEHLGHDYETAIVNLGQREQFAEDYAALNPNRRAPVLKDGDYVLWESNAILGYLADLRPEAGLMPQDARGRADVARWQYWESAHWDAACARLIFERAVKPVLGLGEPDEALVALAEKDLEPCASMLNSHLADHAFLTGDRLTTADFAVGADLTMAEAAALPIGDHPHIRRWYAELSALPAWQSALDMSASFMKR